MVVSDKLKKVIFKKIYEDLSHVEIIPYGNSIWFIDRENKYWYFEYGLNGILFFRYPFFNSFFSLFSLESDDYRLIMSEWVEEVLNHKAHTTRGWEGGDVSLVEEVLNCKVKKTELTTFISEETIKNVLEYSVPEVRIPLEEVLNDNG